MITEYRTYLNPKKVYLPLTDTQSKIANVLVEVGDEVLIGQKVAEKYHGRVKSPILSTVSGEVVGFEERMDRYGKLTDHIVIENDQKNNTIPYPTYSEKATSGQVRKVISEMGLTKIAIDGLYTDLRFDAKSKFVVVNSIFVNEPFLSTDYDFVTQNSEAIADGIDLLNTAANGKTAYVIVDKYMPAEAMEELGKAIVDKNIELIIIDAKKLKGQDYKFIKSLVKETLHFDLLENGVIYTRVQAVKMIHDAVRNGTPPTTRQVSLTGDGLPVNAVYNVRIGTLFAELVEDLGSYTEVENMTLHIGSFLSGIELENDDFAITESVDAINVAEYRLVEEDVCIKCGDCNDVCPAGILPQNIMDAEIRNLSSRIVELNTNECVECGLCTYVCPSKINVLEWVRRGKRRVG
ncbi:MAG: 4Fe-4S dicluster domain-containing protein [Bacilli bacterium]|nr:4Fe-4S dicluster domain-containing protein [Bacilli bacterium]